MTPLKIPIPPQLEVAISWQGEARWIAVCWSSCGDSPWIDDGRSAATGNGWGMLAWWRHPSVAPLLRDADLGSSEIDGTQRLLIDRHGRQAFLASNAEARWFVCDQWPQEEQPDLTVEEWNRLVDRVRLELLSRPLPTVTHLMKQLREHAQVVADMTRWLDERGSPIPGGGHD